MIKKLKCIRCHYELIIPDFTNDQKRELLDMKRAGLDLQVVQRIKNIAKIDLKDSKALMMHINQNYGRCHRCNYDNLITENVICPKCKSVNTNWKID